MSPKQATYVSGHHESVLRSHTWRNASNSAAYLLNHLRPDMKVLDVGCGPGTITIDLATFVPQGHVIGLENAPEVLSQAREAASNLGVMNVEFEVGDVLALQYADATFDVVHAHQVLQHVGDPVQALREMRRVTKPGGIVAARESDFSTMTGYPEVEGWKDLFAQVARCNGSEPDAGRRLHAWAHEAGFEWATITCSTSTWCFRTPEERAWWSSMWAERLVRSSFAKNALDGGHATEEDLNRISHGWRDWGARDDGWFAVLHGEILCRV